MSKITKTCAECGKEFEGKYKRRGCYCPTCKDIRQKASYAKANERRRLDELTIDMKDVIRKHKLNPNFSCARW